MMFAAGLVILALCHAAALLLRPRSCADLFPTTPKAERRALAYSVVLAGRYAGAALMLASITLLAWRHLP